jgi:sensor domain CHASE-containing protein
VLQSIDMVQGGQGFLIYNPIFVGNSFGGFVLAVISSNKWLGRLSTQSTNQTVMTDFILNVSMDGQTIFEQNNSYNTLQIISMAVASLVLFVRKFDVQVSPTPDFIKRNQTTLPELTLLAGILLSFLISIVIYLYLLQKIVVTESLNINSKLEAKIIERKNAESLLAQERQRLRYILDGTDAGKWE